MKKVYSTESASNQRVNMLSPDIDLARMTTVREDLPVAQLTQSKFTVIRVSAKVLDWLAIGCS